MGANLSHEMFAIFSYKWLDTFVFHMRGNSIRAYKLSAIVSMQDIKKAFISKLFLRLCSRSL